MIRLGPNAAFAYAIDPTARLAYARMAGTLTGEQMLEVARTVHEDPAWHPDTDVIWDCTAVAAHVVSPGEVAPIVREVVEDGTGRDVLVERLSLSESFFSMLIALRVRAAGGEAHTCRTVAEALEWLGRDQLSAPLRAVRSEAEAE